MVHHSYVKGWSGPPKIGCLENTQKLKTNQFLTRVKRGARFAIVDAAQAAICFFYGGKARATTAGTARHKTFTSSSLPNVSVRQIFTCYIATVFGLSIARSPQTENNSLMMTTICGAMADD